MNSMLAFCPESALALLGLVLVVQVAVVILLAWVLAVVGGRLGAAFREGVWLSALACILVCPVVTYTFQASGMSIITLARSSTAGAPPEVMRAQKHPGAPPVELPPLPTTEVRDRNGPLKGVLMEKHSVREEPGDMRVWQTPASVLLGIWLA